jgi:hypothetical protein
MAAQLFGPARKPPRARLPGLAARFPRFAQCSACYVRVRRARGPFRSHPTAPQPHASPATAMSADDPRVARTASETSGLALLAVLRSSSTARASSGVLSLAPSGRSREPRALLSLHESRLARASSRSLPLASLAGTTARANRTAGSASCRVRDAPGGRVSQSEREAKRPASATRGKAGPRVGPKGAGRSIPPG